MDLLDAQYLEVGGFGGLLENVVSNSFLEGHDAGAVHMAGNGFFYLGQGFHSSLQTAFATAAVDTFDLHELLHSS